MKKLLIATRNKGKLPEIISKLRGLPFEFLSLGDAGLSPDFEVEESAMTFEGNAIIKAMTYGDKTNLMTLAEDTGLEVDALGGRPGVYSARYISGSDEDRCRKVLEELENTLEEKRGAQFRVAAALYDPSQNKIRTCEGIYRGLITREPHGNGWGYESIFFSTELGKTYAEMTLEEKNSVSHRGRALEKAREIFKQEFSV